MTLTSAFITDRKAIVDYTEDYKDIKKQYLKHESRLYGLKWWDYRRLHPAHATELFAEAYVNALKLDFSQRFDVEKGNFYRGLKHPTGIHRNGPRVLNGLWRARQVADKYGIPYEFYCYEAIRFCAERQWRYLPKVWQIYSTKDQPYGLNMVDTIRLRWKQATSTTIRSPKDTFYTNPMFERNTYQVYWQGFLLKRVEQSPAKVVALSELIYEKEFLREEYAAHRFGSQIVQRAGQMAT